MRELGLSITYEQLDKKSNQITRYLIQIGVKIETLVVIHLNQDMYMISWILGIIKTGSIYVSINKTYPAERKNYIIKDSEVLYFITDEECNDWVKNFFGSTVKPKGVLIEHKNVTSLLMDPRYDYFKYKDSGIRVLQVLFIAFDTLLIGWAMAITNGSTICFAKNPKFLVGNYLLDVIKCNKIEAMNVVPSILATISPNNCSPTLKYLEVGKEVLPNKLVNIWKNHLKKFFNSYGPIETEHFIFHPKLQKHLYHTGDQGCILEDSKIIYLGRFNHQVKLRGLRIELFEVEAVILNHKVIQNKLNKTIVKFQILNIIPVDNLPCTDNGKTNYAKVKNIIPKLLKKTIESEIPRPQPKSSNVFLISHLQTIWQDILALKEKPDINTNFFDLGGHSLLLLQLQKKIQLQI
ncbi:D-alanine-polyphosphoribitol ligase subunit 1 [Gigaspora margarita]|uniref:D-alanine-polyphosphoribitol ligase subunit 1 n=1 Tax=Gigaspora margarita TaxID=4874 RepID=A0A8H4AFR5_GIGMA|nr:D-alanine-polyphosphoribitol ligase subunit 1 [Gigaspora margarita]